MAEIDRNADEIDSVTGWRQSLRVVSDPMLSHLPLNAISTLSVQNDTELSKDLWFSPWFSHAPRLTKLNRVLLVSDAVRAFGEMLEEDVPPDGLSPLPQLTKPILSKVQLTAPTTYHLRDMLVKRKEHGAPLEALDLRTCIGPEREIRLLSEIVSNVQSPARSLMVGHSAFFDWDLGVKSWPLRGRGDSDTSHTCRR